MSSKSVNVQNSYNGPWYTLDEAISSIGSGPFQYKLLFFTGFIWAADAMEMMLLSFLIPKLKEDWNLQQPEDGLIGFVVFAGNLIGTITFSILSDRIGRRKVVIICNLLCAFFGLLCGIAPNIQLLLILRFGVGFAIGGSAVSYVLFAEYAPKETRGSLLIIEQGFWSFGALFSVFLAWICLTYFNWRWYLILSSVPLWIVSVFFKWIPESSRWLYATGKYNDTQIMLKRLAKENNGQLPNGRLRLINLNNQSTSQNMDIGTDDTIDNIDNIENDNGKSITGTDDIETINNNEIDIDTMDTKTNENNDNESITISDISKSDIKRGKISDVFVPAYRKTSILLLIAFFLCVFGYYGISFISERYFENSKKSSNNSDEYWEMAVTTSSEIPGLILGSLFLDRFGRKQCMILCFGIYCFCCFLLTLDIISESRIFGLIFMFVGRMTVSLGFLIIYVYYSEYYPTVIRTTALGFASAMGRIAGMLTSFVSEDLGLQIGMLLYGIGGLISTICILLLDTDTTGIDMPNSIDTNKNINKKQKKGHIELPNNEIEDDFTDDNHKYNTSNIEMPQINKKNNINNNNNNNNIANGDNDPNIDEMDGDGSVPELGDGV